MTIQASDAYAVAVLAIVSTTDPLENTQMYVVRRLVCLLRGHDPRSWVRWNDTHTTPTPCWVCRRCLKYLGYRSSTDFGWLDEIPNKK